MVKKQDRGVIPWLFFALVNAIRNIKKAWFNKRVEKLTRKAEERSSTTGYRYLVILLRGKPVLVKKQKLKEWIRDGTFRKGTTIQQLEKNALYITKL